MYFFYFALCSASQCLNRNLISKYENLPNWFVLNQDLELELDHCTIDSVRAKIIGYTSPIIL